MKILIADDESISRRLLAATLSRLGHEAVATEDGSQAWAELERPDSPQLAILDWNMPGLDGLEICRRLRLRKGRYTYVILVTARSGSGHLVEGLEAGADDFIAKPFDAAELSARVRAGARIVELQRENDRSRSYLSSVLAHMESAVLLSDAAGIVVFANAAYGKMSAISPLDAVGKTRESVVQPYVAGVKPDSVVPLEPPGPDGVLRRFEVEMTYPQRRIVRCFVTPVELPDGMGQLSLYQDITLDADRERRHQRQAMTDTLTGLMNRRGVEEALVRELAHRDRSGGPLSVAIFDIDHFKRVNDTYGHGAGDAVIREVSRVIAGAVRATDIAARWGGEEFLVVLPGSDLQGARLLADRVRSRVEALDIPLVPRVTVSGGIARLEEGEATVDAAVARADTRLYEAKAAGRNAVR